MKNLNEMLKPLLQEENIPLKTENTRFRNEVTELYQASLLSSVFRLNYSRKSNVKVLKTSCLGSSNCEIPLCFITWCTHRGHELVRRL